MTVPTSPFASRAKVPELPITPWDNGENRGHSEAVVPRWSDPAAPLTRSSRSEATTSNVGPSRPVPSVHAGCRYRSLVLYRLLRRSVSHHRVAWPSLPVQRGSAYRRDTRSAMRRDLQLVGPLIGNPIALVGFHLLFISKPLMLICIEVSRGTDDRSSAVPRPGGCCTPARARY